MGVEAARGPAAGARPDVDPQTLWFSTVAPAYADKTNATAIHAALRLGPHVGAFDAGRLGALERGRAVRRRCTGAAPTSSSAPTSAAACPAVPTRPTFGDGAAALLVADEDDAPAARRAHRRRASHRGVPRPLAHARRRPLEGVGGALRRDPLRAARRGGVGGRAEGRRAGGRPGRPRRHRRHRTAAPCAALAKKLGVGDRQVGADLAGTVGNPARPSRPLLLTAALERADARARSSRSWCWPTAPTSSLFRTTDAIAVVDAGPPGRRARRRRRADRLRHLPALARPAHRRAAAPSRAGPPVGVGGRPLGEWKFGFVGSSDDDGEVHLPAAARRRAPTSR